MKLKPQKEKVKLSEIFKDIYSSAGNATDMSIGIDIRGCVTLENFKRIIDCRHDMIELETKDKRVYIYGENIVLADCNKYSATVYGNVGKIEIFSKEVQE